MNLIDNFRKKIKMQLIFFRKLFVISDKKMIDWRWQIPEDAEKTVDGRILTVNFVMDEGYDSYFGFTKKKCHRYNSEILSHLLQIGAITRTTADKKFGIAFSGKKVSVKTK